MYVRLSRPVRWLLIFFFILQLFPDNFLVRAQDGGTATNGFVVSYGGRVYDSTTDRTTFTYVVSGTGVPPDLSHFDLGLPVCSSQLMPVAYNPTDAVSLGTDPTTGIYGIKWDLPLTVNASRTYSVTFAGNVAEGSISIAVKGGNGFEVGGIAGPSCQLSAIDVEKYVSVDGTTWQDADAAPGPDVQLDGQVSFRFVVTNRGNGDLTNITLTDSVFDVSSCAVPATLAAGAFFECSVGPLAVTAGQHTNVATVTAVLQATTVTDADSGNYFGGDRPAIDIEKYVSTGASWDDADNSPGPVVEIGGNVSFRFVVTNTGNVPLDGISLSDNLLDISSCALPATLDPGVSAECIVSSLPAVEGQHTNIGTVTANFNGTAVNNSDPANYFGGDEDLPVIIVIEGPVISINANIVIIYGMEIELDLDDPLLQVIQLGDIIRVEGDLHLDGLTIIVIPINIIIINVEVNINDNGQVWRDQGNCSNPPPPWAPANGWRRRCEGGVSGGDDDEGGMGMGDD